MTQTNQSPRGDMAAFEAHVTDLASGFQYPPTPAIARDVRARLRPAPRSTRLTLARVALAIFVALAALMAVPEVRAAVLAFFRIGAVTIIPATPTPTASPLPIGEKPVTATPVMAPTLSPEPTFSLNDLSGETTLDAARSAMRFPLMLPAYPADLGDPDRVFLQHYEDDVVIMVWMQPDQPDQIRMSLHALGEGVWAYKMGGGPVTELEINGEFAIWTDGPYVLVYGDGATRRQRMIDGHVLIWTVGDVTYRLESDLALHEAVRLAESLR